MSGGGVLARWQVAYNGRGSETDPAKVLASISKWVDTSLTPVTPDGAIAIAKRRSLEQPQYAWLVRFGESPRWLVCDGAVYPLDAKGRLA